MLVRYLRSRTKDCSQEIEVRLMLNETLGGFYIVIYSGLGQVFSVFGGPAS